MNVNVMYAFLRSVSFLGIGDDDTIIVRTGRLLREYFNRHGVRFFVVGTVQPVMEELFVPVELVFGSTLIAQRSLENDFCDIERQSILLLYTSPLSRDRVDLIHENLFPDYSQRMQSRAVNSMPETSPNLLNTSSCESLTRHNEASSVRPFRSTMSGFIPGSQEYFLREPVESSGNQESLVQFYQEHAHQMSTINHVAELITLVALRHDSSLNMQFSDLYSMNHSIVSEYYSRNSAGQGQRFPLFYEYLDVFGAGLTHGRQETSEEFPIPLFNHLIEVVQFNGNIIPNHRGNFDQLHEESTGSSGTTSTVQTIVDDSVSGAGRDRLHDNFDSTDDTDKLEKENDQELKTTASEPENKFVDQS